MDLTISSISDSRFVGKANDRIWPVFEKLSLAFEDLKLPSEESTDSFFVSLVDEDRKFYREIPNNDGIFQVEIGYPDDLSFRPKDDTRLISYIVSRLEEILPKYPASPDDREKIMAAFRKWQEDLKLDGQAS